MSVTFNPGDRVRLGPHAKNQLYSYIQERFDGHEVTVEQTLVSRFDRSMDPQKSWAPNGGSMARVHNDAGQVWHITTGQLEKASRNVPGLSYAETIALHTLPQVGKAVTLTEEGKDLAVKRPEVGAFFQSPVTVTGINVIEPNATFSTIAGLKNAAGQQWEMPVDYLMRAE